jgi:hypothetical protein
MSHRPVWGYQKSDEPTVNQMLQTALANTAAGALPANIQLSLAGHMHIFESLSFLQDSTRPPQIVLGNSGVKLSKHPAKGTFVHTVDGQQAEGNAMREFGYLSLSVGNGVWRGEILGTTGSPLLTCDSRNIVNGLRVCLPVPGG